MDVAETARALWERMNARDWDGARSLLDDGIVIAWPQTGERCEGADAYIHINRIYPEPWRFEVLRVIAQDGHAAVEVRMEQGEKVSYCAAFYDVEDGKLTAAAEYWVDQRKARTQEAESD